MRTLPLGERRRLRFDMLNRNRRLDMLNQNRRRSQLALDRASGPFIPRNLDAPPP